MLDDILFHPRDAQGRAGYHAELTEQQLEFIRNDLALVPKDRLIVYALHSGGGATQQGRVPQAVSAASTSSGSAHTHTHTPLGPEHGWQGKQPHHHLVHVTPAATGGAASQLIRHPARHDLGWRAQRLLIVTFDGNRYRVEYRPARLPDDYVMQVWVPDVVPANQAATNVYVNVCRLVALHCRDAWEPRRMDADAGAGAGGADGAHRRVFSERMAPRAKYENDTLTGPVACSTCGPATARGNGAWLPPAARAHHRYVRPDLHRRVFRVEKNRARRSGAGGLPRHPGARTLKPTVGPFLELGSEPSAYHHAARGAPGGVRRALGGSLTARVRGEPSVEALANVCEENWVDPIRWVLLLGVLAGLLGGSRADLVDGSTDAENAPPESCQRQRATSRVSSPA